MQLSSYRRRQYFPPDLLYAELLAFDTILPRSEKSKLGTGQDCEVVMSCKSYFGLTLLYSVFGGDFEAQAEIVRNEGNKFRVSGFALAAVYGVAEHFGKYVNISSVPCGLDSVSDGSFHS